jgi:hypothetical protein
MDVDIAEENTEQVGAADNHNEDANQEQEKVNS